MRRVIWVLTILLVFIGLAAVTRRTYVLLNPPKVVNTRFPSAAAADAGFATHRELTLVHILPGAIFMILMPLQFVRNIRARHIRFHRWSGRFLVAVGLVVGIAALVMSFKMSIGGSLETAATTFYGVLFLLFLLLGFWNIRQRRIKQHREWMIRAFAVGLGVATTRPVVALFFVSGWTSPHEFFGIAFWIGFTITLLAGEAWIRLSRSPSLIAQRV